MKIVLPILIAWLTVEWETVMFVGNLCIPNPFSLSLSKVESSFYGDVRIITHWRSAVHLFNSAFVILPIVIGYNVMRLCSFLCFGVAAVALILWQSIYINIVACKTCNHFRSGNNQNVCENLKRILFFNFSLPHLNG